VLLTHPDLNERLGTGGQVLQAHPCVRCGYALKGLPIAGSCPECGLAVAQSLKGFMLVSAAPEYVATVRKGATVILGAIVAQVVVQAAGLVAGLAAAFFVAQAGVGAGAGVGGTGWLDVINVVTTTLGLVGVLLTIVMGVGYWLFTSPDPGYKSIERGVSARKLVRASSVVLAVAALLQWVGQASTGFTGALGPAGLGGLGGPVGGGLGFGVAIAVLIVGSLVLVVAWVVQFFGAMRYVSILASRMPDEKLAARAKTYVWLLPLIYILGSCVVVGPLVAMILWAIMLMNIRSRLGEVLLEQQGMGPARGLA
jgi:hypothetical protein